MQTPEHIEALRDYDNMQREFARMMETLSAALAGEAWNDETGEPISIDMAAQEAVLQWETMT